MANFIYLAVCALLLVGIVHGQPLTAEDVVSLLPEIPKTKNETVAAIVEDPVIQDAVQSVVGDGTLSGLVVKKNTVILPADQPDVILTQNEEILTAPLSHLEDIRKNITETAATESEKENSEVAAVDEVLLSEIVPVNDKTSPEVSIPEKAAENPPEVLIAQSLVLDKKEESSTKLPQTSGVTANVKLELPGIVENGIKLPEGIYPGNINLAAPIQDVISKPVVALLSPDNLPDVQEPAINSSPASVASSGSRNSNRDETGKEVPEYGARIPVAVVPSEELDHPAFEIEERSIPEEKSTKNIVAAFVLPEEQSSYYQIDENDMAAAEDIIFRPLFRYRQQQNDRLRVLENRAYNRRTSYNRYRPSSSYENYNPRRNYYKNPQRTRYYNDYY